ncbi:hypothetical protein [Azospirillum sp.]|uniref:hypothetical protein n=1 Tax=Azospirillum sp. TaxID=34012 RepID=UPI002D256CB5|nr:hypothetical protein [Azospirillum sp.]HYD64522.1 hypothetical protein [Azospirillum sp.]
MPTEPVIRVIHQLARTGGTLLNRCLGAMNGVLVLSEIHPLRHVVDPLEQSRDWFGLDGVTVDLPPGTPPDQAFALTVEAIAGRAQSLGKAVVVRDWTHLDFIGVPFVFSPSYRLSTAAALAERFRVRNACVVRHPIDQYLSSRLRPGMAPHLKVGMFLTGYRRFAEQCIAVGFLRYEDIVAAPERRIAEICRRLDLPFDPSFLDHWHAYDKVTGDTMAECSRGLGRREFLSLPRRDCPPDLLVEFESNADYRASLALLGYSED